MPTIGDLALEMTMRDVFDNLEEMATAMAYQAAPHSFEILSIERPDRTALRGHGEASDLPRGRREGVHPALANWC